MNTIDIQKLETLLVEKKFDEARVLIQSTISAKSSEKEQGAMLIDIASIYMQMVNSANATYRDALKEAIEGMKKINKSESRMTDAHKIQAVKESLSK